jgi:hypothetical protein
MTQAHVYLALTEAAVLFAMAFSLDRFALHTNVFLGNSSARAHSTSLPSVGKRAKIPEVTWNYRHCSVFPTIFAAKRC